MKDWRIIDWRLLAITVGGVLLLLLSFISVAFNLQEEHRRIHQEQIAAVQNRKQAMKNATALTALCILRVALDVQIESGRHFLKLHPHGVDGITPAIIAQSIHNNERTRSALNVLACKEAR